MNIWRFCMHTRINKLSYFIKLLMRDEFIRFRNYKNRVALRFRVWCVSAFTCDNCIICQYILYSRTSIDVGEL